MSKAVPTIQETDPNLKGEIHQEAQNHEKPKSMGKEEDKLVR